MTYVRLYDFHDIPSIAARAGEEDGDAHRELYRGNRRCRLIDMCVQSKHSLVAVLFVGSLWMVLVFSQAGQL